MIGAVPAGRIHVLAHPLLARTRSSLRLRLGRSMNHSARQERPSRICPHHIRLRAHQVEAKVPSPPRPDTPEPEQAPAGLEKTGFGLVAVRPVVIGPSDAPMAIYRLPPVAAATPVNTQRP